MDDYRLEEYLRLCAQHERALHAYVHSLVNQKEDAADIIQETRVVMWKHFASFELDSHFPAWAKKIALNQILNYRRSRKNKPATPLDIEFIEKVAEQMDRQGAVEDHRTEALEICLRKLPATHRKMILWRYYDDLEVDEIAERTSRTITATYRFLSRIRHNLSVCIEKQIT